MSTPKTETSPLLINRYPIRRGGPVRQLRELTANLKRYAFLVRQLVRVNLRSGVRRSFIGMSWLVILPLFSVAVWVLLNRAGIVDPGNTEIPYPAFVLLSTSIWGFFAELAKSMSRMLENNGRTLTQTPFPAEVLVAENIVVHLIKFSIPFALNIIVLLAFGVRFSVVALLFPLTLLPLLLLGTAVGLIMSILRVVALDLSNLADEGLRVLMFLTPVVYTPKLDMGWASKIVAANPLTYLVSFSRDVLTTGTFFAPRTYLICVGATLLLFFAALRVFWLAQPRVTERTFAA